MSPTDKKSSRPNYVSTMTQDNWLETTNFTAIGYRYFKKNGFRFEIYKVEEPAFDIQKTILTEVDDYPDQNVTQDTTETRTKKETMGLNLEAIIGNFNYIFEYYQNTDFNEGSSSVKSYPNEIGQKTLLGVAFPLSENLRFGITLSEEDTIQPYSDFLGYYSYSNRKEYRLITSYKF